MGHPAAHVWHRPRAEPDLSFRRPAAGAVRPSAVSGSTKNTMISQNSVYPSQMRVFIILRNGWKPNECVS